MLYAYFNNHLFHPDIGSVLKLQEVLQKSPGAGMCVCVRESESIEKLLLLLLLDVGWYPLRR